MKIIRCRVNPDEEHYWIQLSRLPVIRVVLRFDRNLVAENDDFVTIAPYAPRFPFETWILPKSHESAFENSSSRMFQNLAKAIRVLLNKARVAGDC